MMTLLLLAIYPFLLVIAQFFPISTGFSTDFTGAIAGLAPYLATVDSLLPVGILMQCLGLILVAELLIYGFQFTRWVISHIPWLGGHGAKK